MRDTLFIDDVVDFKFQGPAEEQHLKLSSRVVYFAPDSTPKKGWIRWLGRVDKIMCAGVECVRIHLSRIVTLWITLKTL